MENIRRLFLMVLLVAPAAAWAQAEFKFSLAAPFDGSNAAYFFAEEKGYYAQEGIKVTMDASGGSGEAVTRVGSGTYDFGVGDINVLMEFISKNPTAAPKAVYMLYYRSPLSVASFGWIAAINDAHAKVHRGL